MILLRGAGYATGCSVKITALLVGELLFAALEPDVVRGMDQAGPDRGRPVPLGTRMGERIAHRGQLIGDRARERVVELGVSEIVPGEVEESRRDRAARWRGVARGASATDAPEPCDTHAGSDE